MMTIDELMLAAIVANEATIYVEIEGKKYRDALDIIRDYQGRKIRGFTRRRDHGVELHLEPEDRPAFTWSEDGEWLLDEDGYTCSKCGAKFLAENLFGIRRRYDLPEHCPKCKCRMEAKQ